MPIKTIAVNLNDIHRLDETLQYAVGAAARFNAMVTGIYVIPAVQIYPSIGFEAVPQTFEGHRNYFRERQESVRSQFLAVMQKHGIESKFEVSDAPQAAIAGGFLRFVRRADLAIVALPSAETAAGIEADFVENVLLSAGRPVIVLPPSGTPGFDVDTIVVGWNGAREATRAVFDALPMLRLAKSVKLIIVDPQRDPEFRDRVAGINISEALARHGISCEPESYATEGLEHGEALLRKARECQAGLIVMGAYGHSRLAEFVFGGATRSVIDKLDRPVLFSH